MNPPTWSYSALKSFEDCPKRYYHTKVVKDYVEPDTEALRYGNEFHKAAELYIKDGTPLPAKFGFAEAILESLNAMPGRKIPEMKMGLTAGLKACKFFAKDVWYRGIADLIIVNGNEARVIDYKTGKSARYADKGQLELMALSVFAHLPEVVSVKGGLLFVVCNAFIKETYTVSNTPRLWQKWLNKYGSLQDAFDADTWNPKPSGLCKAHCVVESCLHNGRNR
jgi:hypothetical protein